MIRDQIGDLTFEISPASFYQVNPVQTERLYDKVREYCGFSAKADARDPLAMPEALPGERGKACDPGSLLRRGNDRSLLCR